MKNIQAKTDSMRRIWKTIQVIPFGKVASYGQVADLAGLPGRARLVGKALGSTPKEIKLPWFRVLRSSGQLAFEKGSVKAERQKKLLQQENVIVSNNRVNIKVFGWQPDLAELLIALEF
jgi:methylated-DNA-protein-cysteine methyltransferase related protein